MGRGQEEGEEREVGRRRGSGKEQKETGEREEGWRGESRAGKGKRDDN